jgi:hypothetical protein
MLTARSDIRNGAVVSQYGKSGVKQILTRLAGVIVVCATAFVVLNGCNSEKDKSKPTTRPIVGDKNNGITQCIGRFQLTVPETLRVTGRSQSIYSVDIRTMPLPPDGVQALWQDRLSHLQSLSPPPGEKSAIIRRFELQPGIPGIWYFGTSYATDVRNLEAIRPLADHAVLVTLDGEAGRETVVETLVRNVLNAYVPSQSQGFCVGNGSITSEPGTNEHAGIGFEHKILHGVEISFDTQTVKVPDTRTFSNLYEEKEIVNANGGKLAVLLDHQRSVAGLEGKEMRISVTSPNETPSVRFTWHFTGVPADSSKPMINIKAVAPSAEQKSLETIWEGVLQSVRPTPRSAGAQ